jgi:hypothetical protein
MPDLSAARATAADIGAMLDLHLQALWEAPERAAEVPPLMLWGAPGVGKSAILREAAARHGIGFLDIRLAQREPVDLRGLPVPRGDAVHWLLPAEWPRDPASRGILLFDELTAADRTLQVAAYELILDRRLGDLYALPPGWYVAAAGNRAADRAVAVPMSSALANRFCHLELDADAACWTTWALRRGLRSDVVGFIRYRPDLLLNMEGALERGWPSPRAWERVSDTLDRMARAGGSGRLARLAVTGLVGEGAATEFLAFRAMGEDLPDALAMLEGRIPPRIPARADQRYALCAALAWHMRRHSDWLALADGFLRIGLALPSDFATMAMTDALRDRDPAAIAAFRARPGFAAWSQRHGNAAVAGVAAGAGDIVAATLASLGAAA